MRRWRQGKGKKETYNKKRKEYRKICEKKRDKQQEKIEEEIEQLRNKNDIWKYISKERKRIGITKKISVQEWRKYFMGLLEGQEHRDNEDERG